MQVTGRGDYSSLVEQLFLKNWSEVEKSAL